MTKQLRCVIYIRVSSKEQLEGHSLDAQRDLCTAFAQSRGWQVIAIFEGEGESAKNDKRKSFQKALAFIRQGGADVFLTHKVDRFARNLIDALTYLHELQKLNVTYCAVAEQFDFTTPQGWLMLVMLAALAELFLKNLSAETKKGKRKRAEKGYWNGDLSWGYRVAADGKTAEPDPATAPGFKLAVQLGLAGHSDLDIARRLNAGGYLTSNDRPFSKDTVRAMLQNPFYAGWTTYKGERYPGTHQALIGQREFDRLQESRRARRLVPRQPNPGARVYPLSRLCICGRCTRPLRGITLGRDHNTRYYFDPDRTHYAGSCSNPIYTNAERIEDEVAAYFINLHLPNNFRTRILSELRAATHDPQADERRRDRLNDKLKRLADLYADSVYTRAEYDSRVNQIRVELDSIQPVAKVDYLHALDQLNNFAIIWQAATDNEKRRLFQAILERVVVDEGQVIRLQPKPEMYHLLSYCGPDGHPLAGSLTIPLLPPATPLARIPYLIAP